MAAPRTPAPRCARRAAAALLAALAVGACGKKGPPLPPIRIVPRPAQNLQLRQVGPDVLLHAEISPARTDGTPLSDAASVRILRMRPGPALNVRAVSPRYLLNLFAKEARPVGTIEGPDLKRDLAAGGRITWRDPGALGTPPPSAGAPPPAPGAAPPPGQKSAGGWTPPRYLYSVQVVDGRGERAAIAMPQEIQLALPPPAPGSPKIELTEGEVRLSWEAAAGVAGSSGLYNVYRREADAPPPPGPLNPAPITGTTFVDTTFQYGRTYRYSVRAVAHPAPPLEESAPSEEVESRPLDVYPPKAPTGLAAAVEGATIKLYWFPNSEPDLKEYRVYRRGPEGEAEPIGRVDSTDTSFADGTARKGVRYHYSVTAVDATTPPNESPRSDEVSESLTGEAGPAEGP